MTAAAIQSSRQIFWGGGAAAHKSTGLSVLGEDDLGFGNDSFYNGGGEGDGGNDTLQSPIEKDYDNNDDFPTNAKVGKYFFFHCLTHYMEGVKINQQNRKAVEIVILVEAGTFV